MNTYWSSENKMYIILLMAILSRTIFSLASSRFEINSQSPLREQGNVGSSSKLISYLSHHFNSNKDLLPNKQRYFPNKIKTTIGAEKRVKSATPLHPNEISSTTKELNSAMDEPKNSFLLEEISWRKCSAKKVGAYLDSDIKIRCELWAPLGTNLTWYKDGEIRAYEPHHQFEGQELLSTEYLDDVANPDHKPTGRSKYEFHLATYFYINCVKEEHQGLYKLEVQVPNGRSYIRTFELSAIGYSEIYSMCIYRPIIVDFAKTVLGKKGQELYLPCRPNNYYHVAIVWKREDRVLTEEDYSITDEGDLYIKNLSSFDEGYFICELYYIYYDKKNDEMATYVMVLD